MANYISQVTLPSGSEYNIRELYPHVGTCSDAAATAAKTVTIGNFKLYTGAWVVVKFSNTNSAAVASLTLNVDGTGAKPIKYRNANLSSAGLLIANRYTYFVYDGTNYQIVGDFDTNSDRYVNTASFADDSTNTTASPVKMTLTRAGSDTATVTANIPKVSSTSAGVAPKGTTVSSQSQSTKFLREDGSWAAPSYTSIPSNNVTGSGTSGYLTKWNGTNTITNGPLIGSSTTTFLRNDGSWATPPDTKNTAGSTDTSSKIFLIGATSQAANPQTYSDNEVYTTSGVLTTKKVQVGGGSCTMEYNSTTQSLDFIFT